MPPCPASSVTIFSLAPHATKTCMTFPWRVYRGDHLWGPPLLLERKAFLNPRRNPFFQHAQVPLFLAQQGKEIVGRIVAVNPPHHADFIETNGFSKYKELLALYRHSLSAVSKKSRLNEAT